MCTDGVTMQEISQMLAGQLSNQEEDEVEDELAALESATERPVVLPNVPVSGLPEDRRKEDERKAAEQARAKEQTPMLTAA